MKNKTLLVLLPGLLLVAGAANAQDDKAPERYTYATYFYCNTSNEGLADKYVEESETPVMDKLVDDGTYLGWGWLRHHTGGQWRRIRYFQTDSLQNAIAGIDAMGEAFDEAFGEDDQGIGVSCDSHDDYVWKVEAGTSGVDRGSAGLSVYFSCKITEEDRADEIVAENFAPIYDKLVKEGKITSWGWQSHVVGGWFRRLFTMSGKDYATLLAARGEALAAQFAEDNKAGAEFSGICSAHHDYLWDIVYEKRGGK